MQIEKPLSTARITARSSKKTDLPYLTAMWFDEENGKYLSDPTAEYVDARYQAALDEIEVRQNGYYLTVVLNGTETIIGSFFAFPDEKKERFEIAYCIRKDHWGKGFGSELLSLMVDWIRGKGGVEIIAEAAKDNTASDRLLKRIGFKVAGESRFQKYNMDIFYESFVYILRLSGSDAVTACPVETGE